MAAAMKDSEELIESSIIREMK
jgi:hypothetical protein